MHKLLTEHHGHLARWLSEGDDGQLQAFLGAHGSRFSFVSASGEILTLAELRAGLSEVGGTQPGLTIEIEDVTQITTEVHRFIECHVVRGVKVTERVVTVVAREGRVLSVQETARHSSVKARVRRR